MKKKDVVVEEVEVIDAEETTEEEEEEVVEEEKVGLLAKAKGVVSRNWKGFVAGGLTALGSVVVLALANSRDSDDSTESVAADSMNLIGTNVTPLDGSTSSNEE